MKKIIVLVCWRRQATWLMVAVNRSKTGPEGRYYQCDLWAEGIRPRLTQKNPVSDAPRGCGAIGSAPALQAGG